MVRLSLQGGDVQRAIDELGQLRVDRAAQMAINTTARRARTEASKLIRGFYNLPARRVNDEVRNAYFARTSDLDAALLIKGRPIGLMNFGAQQVSGSRVISSKGTRTTRKPLYQGVRVRIVKDRTALLRHAFIARGRRGKQSGEGALHVFARVGSGRGLRNLAAVTIVSMFSRFEKKIDSFVDKFLPAEFNRHIDRMLSRLK